MIPMALVGALAIAACSSSSDGAVGSTKTPTSGRSGTSVAASINPNTTSTAVVSRSPSTTAAATGNSAPQDADLVASVRAYWDIYLDVGLRSSALDASALRARLGERAAGDQLRQLVAFFTTNKNSGFVVRGELDIAPVIVASTATSAQVRDCHDDRTGLFRADGSRVDTDNPLRHQVLMTLVVEGGVWKVASTTDEGYGCAA